MPSQNRGSTSVAAVRTCGRCGPTAARCDTWAAVGLVGVLLGVMAGAVHMYVATGAAPRPSGLYVAVVATAVTALWIIGRAFSGRHG